jgi:signal recognition particle receptor subunit beta
MELNNTDKSLKIKIAYYGPAIGGKTTNLNVLYQHALVPRRGDFISINSQQDRTILCDLLPLRAGGFCGFDVRLQLLAVPGQSIYLVSRRAVLRGSDGIVFVANSAVDRWQENLQSFSELNTHLRAQKLDPATIPLVFQYNKRDLPEVLEIPVMNRGLNQRAAPAFEAVARKGEGVLETLAAILDLTLEDLSHRHGPLVVPPGQTVAAWTARAIRSVFGRDSLSGVVIDEEQQPAASRPLKLQIAMGEEAGRAPTGPTDVRSAESLAESYAEASAELALAMNDLRVARDRAEARLAEIQVALEMAEAGTATLDLEARVLRVLEIVASAADASNASFFLTMGEVPEILFLPPLISDPLARIRAGTAFLAGQVGLREVVVYLAGEDVDLTEALAKADPPFKAVALVPFRSAERLLGLALLYFWPHAPLPSAESLQHIGLLARVLSGPLEATAAREADADAARLRTLSQASASAMVSVLTRLPPHALRRQPLALQDLLAPLRAPGVTVEVAPGTSGIEGDAALLRFALTTLIHRCEAACLERDETPAIRVWAQAWEFTVQIHVMSGGALPGGAGASETPRFDGDAEMSAVNAVLAQHGGYFVVPEGEVSTTHFTLQFDAI